MRRKPISKSHLDGVRKYEMKSHLDGVRQVWPKWTTLSAFMWAAAT